MIALYVRYKKTKKTIRIVFKDYDELKEIIKKIKPSDMMRKDFWLDLSPGNYNFLIETYKREFFKINYESEIFVLEKVPNGVRRTLAYNKNPNNNGTLAKVLERIEETLTKEFDLIDFAFEIKKTPIKQTRFHFIEIKLVDLRENEQKIEGHCVIKFDKQKWSYDFVEISTTRLHEVFTIIKNVFDKKTSPTKAYRRKRRLSYEDYPERGTTKNT